MPGRLKPAPGALERAVGVATLQTGDLRGVQSLRAPQGGARCKRLRRGAMAFQQAAAGQDGAAGQHQPGQRNQIVVGHAASVGRT